MDKAKPKATGINEVILQQWQVGRTIEETRSTLSALGLTLRNGSTLSKTHIKKRIKGFIESGQIKKRSSPNKEKL